MSTGESPPASDPGVVSSPQASGVKVLETLKKQVFEHSDSPSKTLSSREVCSSFSDLTAAVFSSAQRANSSVVVSGAIELLVHACSNQDRAIRLAGQENLHKLVKKLQSTHLSRLQQDLFHELKKNGSARSLSVALEVFAALFPRTRPSRRHSLSQSLLPVLLRLLARDEEALHEALQDALSHILPSLTPFLSTTNTQLLMSALLERLPGSPASYRRMTAATLTALSLYAKSPLTLTEWLVAQMMNIGCQETATEQTCQGILLTLQNMASSQENFTVDLLKQVYGFILSCMLYRDGNTTVSAMEAMNTLLLGSSPALCRWLMTAHPSSKLATQFWKMKREEEGEGEGEEGEGEGEEEGENGHEEQDSSSDAHSLKEEINDAYFSSDQGSSPVETVESSPVSAGPGSTVVEIGCFAVKDGPNQPLSSLTLYLTESVLVGRRVSAVSVGLACLTSCADLAPSLLLSLSPYLPFTCHADPKLKSRSAKLLAVLIRAVLRESSEEASASLISEAVIALRRLLADSSPVVLKAVCESLRICLPSLASSSQPHLAVELVEPLLAAACSSSYWLAKVELLRTLACLPVTALALSLPSLPNSLLSLCVFPLLGDSDHRVRTAAAQAVSLLVPSLQLTADPVLAHAHWEVSREFPPLNSSTPQLSLASVGMHSCKVTPPAPLGLQHLLWFLVANISSSESHALQRGCLEALHMLCSVFPPASLPQAWGCDCNVPSLLPTSLSLLTGLQLAWTVQGQQQLLDVSAALFLSCSLSAMDRLVQSGHSLPSSSWAALGDSQLAGHAGLLLRHVGRLLAVFIHVLEGREPENRETKRMAGVSPKKAAGRDSSPVRSSPAKPKVIIENLQRPPLIPRDGLGQFASSQPHLKILDTCRSAYTNYQVSLAGVGEDKFSRLLQSTHNLATVLLEVALAADVSKHVEELMNYFTITFQVDPSGALLCVQQLLNALFGMNAAAQHTSIHSPYLSSLSFELRSLHRSSSPSPSPHPLVEATLSQPLAVMERWLDGPPPQPLHSPSSHTSPSLPRKRILLSGRRALVVKPVNSVSSVKDYIAHFEPLVVSVVKRFPHTSSLLLQQRTLFLLVQLLQLKVRYELLDCNHTFLDSVLKLVGLIESGVVRDGEELVPFLFQFLVLLAYDNSQLVSIPEVMQRCDGVMASGHSVDTFAIPALQPLVLNLFVRPGKESSELDTQREVVLSMLLRVIDHSRVLSLLTHVLDCFSRSSQHWQRVSGQILASLLNAIARLSIVLDSPDSMETLYHLFSAMDPSALSVKALFVSVLKLPVLTGSKQLCRWLAILNTVLTLMRSLFPESTLFSELNSITLTVPAVKSEEVDINGDTAHLHDNEAPPTRLAWFLLGVLRVTVETQLQLERRPGRHPQPLLPQLLGRCLLLLSSLLSGEYENLRKALTSLSFPQSLSSAFLSLAPFYPLLTLHYWHFSLLTGGRSWVVSVLQQRRKSQAPSHHLLYHCLLPLVAGSESPLMNTVSDGTLEEETLIQQLVNFDLSSPTSCMRALQLAKVEGSERVLPFLCRHLVTHPFSSISSPAASLTIRILADKKVSSEVAGQLLPFLSAIGNRYPELLSVTQQLADIPSAPPPQTSPSHPLQFTLQVQAVTKLWFLAEVHDLCRSSCSDHWLCGRVLARLSLSELSDLLQNPDIPNGLLVVCVSHGLELSLFSPSPNPHPLLQASSARLLELLDEGQGPPSLLPPLLWLLLAHETLSLPPLNEPSVQSVLTAIAAGLQDTDSTMLLQTSLDCLSLGLSLREIQRGVNDAWLITTVPLVVALAKGSTAEVDRANGSPSRQLHSALSHCLAHRQSPPLGLHTHTALLSLARLPSLHPSSLIPPLLLSPDSQSPSEQALDQALLEGEVLQQYMARSNTIGWLGRAQFEERWMQLLGVVNQPPPPEGMPLEEVYAHTLNMCVGLVGVVSLLLATSLRPQQGNPVFGVPLHSHRNRDILFLGTKPGRRLSMVRSLVETQLLRQCAGRPNLYSHYQCPLLSQLSLPLFTRNLERGPGETELGPAQLSLKSLWPVTLANPTSPARHSPDGVDVRSCVLSLVDLFSHWLGQPIHPLLLLHTLRAILMLSDLFSLPSQFEWMMQLACDLSDKQPSEDTATHSILIQCMLKAGAVLKVDKDGVHLERIVRSAERALSSESLEVQDGCLCGLLYVVEDPSSQLAAHLAAPLAKYLPPQLESFHRLSESHCSLCWSLAVSLALHHSHLLKDAEFPRQLLEKAIPLLLHPHTSALLFHSLCIGLELLVLNFTLSNDQRSKVSNVTASRCAKCELDKVLPALGLLVSCMYSGEQGNSVNEDEEADSAAEMSVQMREHVGILVEHLRHGSLEGVRFLVDIVPVLMVDFLPPVQVLQMVVTEFVSPHQPRPALAAVVMGETFSLLLGRNMGDTLTDWVLLSLDSFVQQEPEKKAVWCLVCLLTAASTSSLLRAMLQVVANQPHMCLSHLQILLATASFYFCTIQVTTQQQKVFIDKFLTSNYPTLNTVAHACLHSV